MPWEHDIKIFALLVKHSSELCIYLDQNFLPQSFACLCEASQNRGRWFSSLVRMFFLSFQDNQYRQACFLPIVLLGLMSVTLEALCV